MTRQRSGRWLKVVGVLSLAVLFSATPNDPPVAGAAMRGEIAEVRSLLQSGADVNAAQGDGMTALHWAARRGDAEMAGMLLYAGANVRATTRLGGYTSLLLASAGGHASIISLLCEAGADVNLATSTGATPLHLAAASGQGGAVSVLLDNGAEIDVTESKWQQTPLMFAAAANRLGTVEVLLDRGAEVDRASKYVTVSEMSAEASEDRRLRSALLAAVRQATQPNAPRAVTDRSGFGAGDGGNAVVAQYCTGCHGDRTQRGSLTLAPFDVTSAGSNVAMARKMITRLREGEMPPPSAQRPADSVLAALADEVEKNLTVGVPAAGSQAAAGGRGARGRGQTRRGRRGQARGAQRGRGTRGGQTAGAQRGRGNRGQGRGAQGRGGQRGQNPTGQRGQQGGGGNRGRGGGRNRVDPIGGRGGLTALHHAARQGNSEVVEALLDAGADINKLGEADKSTPLLIATINGHFDLAMRLLERGADPNLANTVGAAPLYGAVNIEWAPTSFYPQPTTRHAKTTLLEYMTALLEAGANPDARLTGKVWYSGFNFDQSGENETGATPFWRAAQSSDLDAMRLLVTYGADPELWNTVTRAFSSRAPRRQQLGDPPPEEEEEEDETKAKTELTTGEKSELKTEEEKSGLVSEEDEVKADDEEALPDLGPPTPVGGPATSPLHIAAGAGFDGNFRRNSPAGFMPAVRYLVEELGYDVNSRDYRGYTAMHHAALRGDNEMILYLVEHGGDPKVVSRSGQTTVDMANGPRQRVQPFEETIKLLEGMGAKNNHRAVSR